MPNTNKNILYITHCFKHKWEAGSVNSRLRINLLRDAGFSVTKLNYESNKLNFLFSLYKILIHLDQIDLIVIRIDGSCILEKFSLLKLFNKKIVWEVHGGVGENLINNKNFRLTVSLIFKRLKRRFFAYFVDGCVCVSKQLVQYTTQQLSVNNNYLIPNFVSRREINIANSKSNKLIPPVIKYLDNPKFYKVVFGGGFNFPWQAIDLIDKVAKEAYVLDKKVVFIVAGDSKWFNFSFHRNVLYLDAYPHQDFLKIVQLADVCLALYYPHKLTEIPFYHSSLKLLEEMALGKPVIATEIGQIEEIIRDGKNGLLTNNSPEDIVKKIIFLKKNPPVANDIGIKAKKTIFKYYTDKQALRAYQLLKLL